MTARAGDLDTRPDGPVRRHGWATTSVEIEQERPLVPEWNCLPIKRPRFEIFSCRPSMDGRHVGWYPAC